MPRIKWIKIRCTSCNGQGIVPVYTLDGSDFLDPDECTDCNGRGSFHVHYKTGAMAHYPGGPFCGSITKYELNEIKGKINNNTH